MSLRILAFFDSSYQSILGEPAPIANWHKLENTSQVSRHHFPLNHPATLGMYDLANPAQCQMVISMAKQTGIDGFVVDIVKDETSYKTGAAPLKPFCENDFSISFRWRNETEDLWKKPGNGETRTKNIQELIQTLKAAWPHADDRLLLIVNDPVIDDVAGLVRELRQHGTAAGLPPLHLIANRAEDDGKFIDAGFDLLLDPGPGEWHSCRPNNQATGLDYLEVMAGLKDSVEYLDKFFSYPLFTVARMINREKRGPVLPRVFASFYNWAIFPEGGATHLVNHGNKAIDPYLFGLFVENAILFTSQNFVPDQQIVFLDSWNSWLEGSQIEPSLFDGDIVTNAARAAIDRGRYMIRTRMSQPNKKMDVDMKERIELLCEAAKNIG